MVKGGKIRIKIVSKRSDIIKRHKKSYKSKRLKGIRNYSYTIKHNIKGDIIKQSSEKRKISFENWL